MATIRELRTQFSANAQGMKSAINSVRKDIKGIGDTTQKSVEKSNKSLDDLQKELDKTQKKIDGSTKGKSFEKLNKTIEKTRKEIEETGQAGEESMKDFQKEVEEARKEMEQLDDADLNELEQAINAAETEMKALGNEALTTKGKVETLDDTNLDNLKNEIEDAGDSLQLMGGDVDDLNSRLARTRDGGWFQDFRESVMNITVSLRGLRYALVGLAPAAVPVFGSLAVGAMGLASSFAAAGAGAVGFGTVAVAAISEVIEKEEELKKAREKLAEADSSEERLEALKEIQQIESSLTEQQKETLSAMQEFRGFWDDFVGKFENVVLGTFMLGMETLEKLLINLEPMIGGTADAVYHLIDAFNSSLDDTDVQKFFEWLAEDDGMSLQNLAKTAGNFMKGIMNLMVAFGPLADKMEGSLLDMSEAFAEWTSKISESQGFKNFIEYAKEQGPVVMDFLKNMSKFLINFSILISPVGDAILKVLSKAFEGLDNFVTLIRGVLDLAKGDMVGFAEKITGVFGQKNGLKVMNFFLNIRDGVNKAREKLKPFKQFLEGLFAIFSNDDEKGANILKSLGLTSGQIQMIINAINKIQDWINNLKQNVITNFQTMMERAQAIWGMLWPFLKPLLMRILNFVTGVISDITKFWDENGAQIKRAVDNAFKGILAVIKFIMPLVMAIINTVWGAIENIIKGALKVIMGAIKVFTGLFTGDFRKMWEGLKQMFFGAIQLIWGWINLTFFGRIIKGAKVFILGFKTAFLSMWKAVVSFFKGNMRAVVSNLKEAWTAISNATSTVFSRIWNFLKNTWNSIKSIFSGSISFLVRAFETGWNTITGATFTAFRGIWNFLKSIWNTVKTFISGSVSSIFTRVRDTWNGIWSSTKNIFTKIYNSIKDRFTDIVNRAKELPGKIGDGIGKMASKVKSGVTKVINSLASTLGKGVNGVIGGINWVLDKVGVDAKVPKWEVPQYAKGTKGHPGGPAIVGDGKGANAGPELITTPDGQMGLSPATDTLMNLPKGSHVLSAKDTKNFLKSLPAYAWGTGVMEKTWSGVKNIASDVKNAAFDVWSYISNPSKLFNKALDFLGVSTPNMSGVLSGVVRGLFSKVKNGVFEHLKGLLSGLGGNGAPNFGYPFVQTSGFGRRSSPGGIGSTYHRGLDFGAPVGTPIPAQGGGKVTTSGYNSVRGNYVIVRSGNLEYVYQHNSRNLVGVGETVRKGQIIGTVGSTGASTGPHLHYEVRRNGVPFNPGYEKGGFIENEHTATVGEGGKEEVIIPLEQYRSRAIGLWQEAGKRLGLSSDTMAVLYNSQEGVVSALRQQTQQIVKQTPIMQEMVTGVYNMRDFLAAKAGEVIGQISKAVASNVNNAVYSLTSEINAMGQRVASAARKSSSSKKQSATDKYFAAVRADGDWMNDWATHVPNSQRAKLYTMGYKIAKSMGETGKNAYKHLKRLRGYDDGGIVNTAQLAWIAEGGWAESIISHDPAKRQTQQRIWEKTGEELGFNQNGEVISLLEDIREGVMQGKSLQVIMNERVVGELVEPAVSNQQRIKKERKNKKKQ